MIHDRIESLPWHPTRIWSEREMAAIDKIVVHQQLGHGTVEQVNRYHITPSPGNHLSVQGAPHFGYHYGIELDATIVQANRLTDVTWHTRGENTSGVGIMVCGAFKATGQGVGLADGPSYDQMSALRWLVDHLRDRLNLPRESLYGHYHFGKPACPGKAIEEWIEIYRDEEDNIELDIDLLTAKGVQQALAELDYSPGPIDGIWGQRTAISVRLFQDAQGLVVDGVVGPQTRKRMRLLLAERRGGG